MTLDDCTSFEIAIERDACGAASPEERAALAAHVESCAACRGYADNTAFVRGAMMEMEERLTSGGVDWDAIEARIRGALAQRLRRFFMLLGIGALAVVICIVGFGETLTVDLTVVGVVGAILAVRSIMVMSESRALNLAHGQELFAAHRIALATRIRSLEGLRWVALGVVLLLLGLAAFLPDIALRARLTYVALAFVVGGVWGHNVVVELPRLGRELRALGDVAK